MKEILVTVLALGNRLAKSPNIPHFHTLIRQILSSKNPNIKTKPKTLAALKPTKVTAIVSTLTTCVVSRLTLLLFSYEFLSIKQSVKVLTSHARVVTLYQSLRENVAIPCISPLLFCILLTCGRGGGGWHMARILKQVIYQHISPNQIQESYIKLVDSLL